MNEIRSKKIRARRRKLKFRRWLRLEPIKRRYRRWKKRDRRKRSYDKVKWAINRDGDLYLVECPKCHRQRVWWWKEKRLFSCNFCDIYFSVYTEDGVVKLKDHREGDVVLPAVAVYDEACGLYRLGIKQDVPWWWTMREVYRDLRNGKDAHGHEPYRIIEVGRGSMQEQPAAAIRAGGDE